MTGGKSRYLANALLDHALGGAEYERPESQLAKLGLRCVRHNLWPPQGPHGMARLGALATAERWCGARE
jgi:hypothetical protein